MDGFSQMRTYVYKCVVYVCICMYIQILNVNNHAGQKKHAIKGERSTMDLIVTRRI